MANDVFRDALQFTLPLDLFAKGLLSFEVWDADDTKSDFLGGADISLHLLWKEGQRDTRSLAVVTPSFIRDHGSIINFGFWVGAELQASSISLVLKVSRDSVYT